MKELMKELTFKNGNYETTNGVTIIRVVVGKRMSCKTVWVRTDEIISRDATIYETLTEAANQERCRAKKLWEIDKNTMTAILRAVTEWKAA